MRCWHCSKDFEVTAFDKEVRCPRCDTPLGYQTESLAPPMVTAAVAKPQVAKLKSAPASRRSTPPTSEPAPHMMRCWHCGKSFEITTFDKEVHCPRCDSKLGFQTPMGTVLSAKPVVQPQVAEVPPTTASAPAVLPPPLPQQEPPPAVVEEKPQFLSEHQRGFIASRTARYGLLLAGLCLSAVGAGLGCVFWEQWKSAPLLMGVVFGVVGPALLLYGLVITFAIWRIRLTTHGLSWTNRKGEHHCSWDDVTAVYRREVYMGNKDGQRFARLRIEIAGQGAIGLSQHLSSYDQLCETVQTITIGRLLARKRAELAKGAADFGPVILRNDGIRINLKDIPWEQFGYYCISNGHFVAYRADAKNMRRDAHLVQLQFVPNYLVLLTLLEEMGKRQISAEESDRI